MAWCHPTIEFAKEVYFPGEQVTGKVFVSTTKDMSARNVEISFIGQALTAWRDQGKRTNEPVADHTDKKAEDTFLEIKHVVWAAEDEKNTFPAGDYEWEFSFDLPTECSASFEGFYGYIRYFVRAHIDVPLWIDTKVESAITVSPTIDLNYIPGANQAVEIERVKMNAKLSCLPFLGNYGPVIYKIHSPKIGFVPGEKITISGTIENRSSKTLYNIEAKFIRRVVYRDERSTAILQTISSTPDSFNSKTVNEVFREETEECEICPGVTKTFELSLKVPLVVATIRSSKCISVEYLVTVEAGRRTFATSDVPEFSIIIGNVPILKEGTTTLPHHRFFKSHPARCWSSGLKPEFCIQYPWYELDKN